MAPVDHVEGGKAGIRNDEVDVVVCTHRGGAGSNVHHVTVHFSDLDAIPDLDRPFEENEYSADEVVGNVLQTEADSYTHSARHQAQHGQIDLGGALEQDQEPHDDDQVLGGGRDRVADAQVHGGLVEDVVEQQAADPPGQQRNHRESPHHHKQVFDLEVGLPRHNFAFEKPVQQGKSLGKQLQHFGGEKPGLRNGGQHCRSHRDPNGQAEQDKGPIQPAVQHRAEGMLPSNQLLQAAPHPAEEDLGRHGHQDHCNGGNQSPFLIEHYAQPPSRAQLDPERP